MTPEFLWGVATSAYQIEGATTAHGRGESIWDRFCRVPGNVRDGATGDIACDHYRRWEADVELLAWLGVGAYRFSIAWPRILPRGEGTVNDEGVRFYRRLASALRACGIRPVATLYHWDLPAALQDRGGWASRNTAAAFAAYADTAFDTLGDVIEDWITINEPSVVAFDGHWHGTKAPGRRDRREAFAAAHHLLLAHGLAVEAFRRSGRDGRIGIAINVIPVIPADDTVESVAAAERLHALHNGWFADPVCRGRYPEALRREVERHLGPLPVDPGDAETIAAPLDFFGLNYYSQLRARTSYEDGIVRAAPAEPHFAVTEMGWEVAPDALRALLATLSATLGGIPVLVTENGAAYDDVVVDGSVDDAERVDYLRRHVRAVEGAIADGANVAGYFVWSLLDNFEWEHGYSKRFGIVHVDYATQRRLPKRSAVWYRNWIRRTTRSK